MSHTSQISSEVSTEQIDSLQKLSVEESAKSWAYLKRICVQDNPLLLIEEGKLKIKTKKGLLIPLKLNKAQQRLHSKISALWQQNKIIRVIILKARQLGISTYVEALIYAITSQWNNQNSLIISHDVDGSNYLFEMSKLYQEECPEWLRPEVKRSNEKKLEFDKIHSQILIDTADNKEAGRGFTFRIVHLSEVAFFKKPNYEEITLGLGHSVPTLERTIVVKESTANGYNHFKDDWDRAVSGESDELAVFIPWYWGEEYQMVVEDFKIGDATYGDIAKEEPELASIMEKEGIDSIPQRLQWRRWDIRNNCKGDVDKFKQENPSTPEEAFLASGQCFFHQKNLVKQQSLKTKPLFRANILKENYKYVIRECSDGDFYFYQRPNSYSQYCVGGDACSGSGADNAGLVARDKGTNEIVAVYHAKCDPDELAYRAMMLGSLLNNALVALENDKFGFAANKKLVTIYGNVYVQRTYNKIENRTVEKFGWDTTAITRPLMLGQMQEEIREDSLALKDMRIIRECLTFIKNPKTGKAEAEPGFNDDLVIATAISGQIRQEEPYKIKPEREAGVDVKRNNAGLSFKRRR